jgi:N6-adenosine-specific RNA methylase IME4
MKGLDGQRFSTVLADPPWRFQNSTGKVSPEHRRLRRYRTMSLDEIAALPVEEILNPTAHLYLWVPNALIAEGLAVMSAWGFTYKANIVWHKVRTDGGSDGRGVGFYFRNVTELVLFGVRGKNARTLAPARRQVNLIATRKREHSRKPDELYPIIEACSPGPYIELFARGTRPYWQAWGDDQSLPSTGGIPCNRGDDTMLDEALIDVEMVRTVRAALDGYLNDPEAGPSDDERLAAAHAAIDEWLTAHAA